MKHSLRSFLAVLISVAFFAPAIAQAAPMRYVEVADMAAATQTLQDACKDSAMYSSAWYTCVYDFTQIGQTNTAGHGRVTIKDKAVSFSVALPQNSAWHMGAKPVRAYAVKPLTGDEAGTYFFGPVQILCSGMQDVTCRVDRTYALTVSKESVKQLKDKLASDLKAAKESHTFQGEELPVLEYTANGNKIILLPNIVTNSGSVYMQYSGLIVERKGHVYQLASTSFNWGSYVDLELWRVAESIR